MTTTLLTDELEIQLSPRGRHLLSSALHAIYKASEFEETGVDYEQSRNALLADLYRIVDVSAVSNHETS